MYILFLVLTFLAFVLVAGAEHRCDKDETGKGKFYDGEAFMRDCSDCDLNGNNVWVFDCYPCCNTNEGSALSKVKDGLSGGELTGIVVGVLLTVGIFAAVVAWKLKSKYDLKEMRRQSDAEAAIALTPTPTTAATQAVDDAPVSVELVSSRN